LVEGPANLRVLVRVATEQREITQWFVTETIESSKNPSLTGVLNQQKQQKQQPSTSPSACFLGFFRFP